MKQIQPTLHFFRVRDEREVKGKIEKFREQGRSKLQMIADFDHTVTAGKKPGENIGTWNLFDLLMSDEDVKRHDAIYAEFRPKEIAGVMTEEEAVNWWSASLGLITSSGINLEQAQDVFLREIKARAGTKQLFDSCNKTGVPVVILSAGVKQVIQMILERYDLDPDLVLATELKTDTTGLVTGWDKNSLIHNLNKREMGHQEMSTLLKTRPNAILIGDDPADSEMFSGEAIRIRVFDPRTGEVVDEDQYEKESFAAGFDLIVEYSLEPVADLVGHITGPAHHSR